MNAPAFDQLRALVIDDDKHMRKLLRSLLLALGFQDVEEATNGLSGYDELRAKKPDFVLTDLSMKPLDGIAFTRMVRTAADSPNPYLPIIMVSGHAERSIVEDARDVGVTEFIVKPVTLQNLQSRITEIIERPRPFVCCPAYFGPDRRRRVHAAYAGPWRRAVDRQDMKIV